MKFLFQITLLSLLFIITFIFYENYFTQKEVLIVDQPKVVEVERAEEDQKNVIKNLKYNVELSESGNYEIKSDSSEVILKNGYEIIKMKNVIAIFTDKNNNKLYINSKNAEFDSTNYNTQFIGNIIIKYKKNTITSNYLDFDFVKNNIMVYENVIYSGIEGKIQTDNIKIDLITKNVEIFMNDENKNIKAISF